MRSSLDYDIYDGWFSAENLEVVLPTSDEEYVRIVRKVETKDTEPRNFIKDKLCAIGLADVSNMMQLCNIRTLGMVTNPLLIAVLPGCVRGGYPVSVSYTHLTLPTILLV